MMAELFGRATGPNRGKGGSMHIADFSVGMLGANGVVAAGMPIAVGAAHALKLRRRSPDRRLLLRRRRDQPRPVPRGAQLGRDPRAAGALRVRGQPLVGDHADRRDDRGRGRAGARAGDRRAGRRRWTATMSSPSIAAAQAALLKRSERQGPAVPARDHLPLQRPRLGRRRGVSRRRRSLEGAGERSAGRSPPKALDRERRKKSMQEAEEEVRRALQAAASAPWPDARDAYNDVQDTGGGQWR